MSNPQNNPGAGPSSTSWAQHWTGSSAGAGEAYDYFRRQAQNQDQQPQQQNLPRPQYRPPLTPDQKRARLRLRWLRVINLLLILPFLATLDWWVQGTRYVSPPLFVLVLIVAIWASNQVIKYRLKQASNPARRQRNSRV